MTRYVDLHFCNPTDNKSNQEGVSKPGKTDEQLIRSQTPSTDYSVGGIIPDIKYAEYIYIEAHINNK